MNTVNGLTFHVFSSSTGTVSPFPTNGTPLDDFTNRTSLGSNWSSTGGGWAVTNNSGTANDYLRSRNGSTTTNAWWTSGPAFGNSQEAYFTFIKISGQPTSNEQGLLLKYSGGSNPNSNSARWIEVALDNNNTSDPEGATVRIRTKSGTGPLFTQFVERLNIDVPGAVFQNGDQLGARALNDGTVIVYKNGSELGRVTVAATGSWTGRIGTRFEGTGSSSSVEARVDNFGGGNVTLTTNTGSQPTLFEVGPGHPYSTIQSAIDAAAAQSPYKDSLIVVYPGAASGNPRYNGRGAYLENPIMYAPVKLQGVGPGGVRPDSSIVQGSIIDGAAFGGDTALSLNWLGKVSSLTWDGNQDINDGQVIYVLASDTGDPSVNRAGSFGSSYKASIDGFDIRGGDQQGIPGNLNAIFGGEPAGPPRAGPDPGRRDLRERLRPQPADHEQRDRKQRRRVRHHPHWHAQSSGALARPAERQSAASPTTAFLPMAGPTWPARSAFSTAPRITKSPATTCAATSRPNTAARSATSASARTARSTTTAFTSTAPTMKAPGS